MGSKDRTSRARESAAVWVPVSELTVWEDNPRLNDGEPVEKVAESIRRFGFASPIIARKANNEVIAGHTRLKAAALLGIETVPVRFLDLDPTEAHLLALADNRLAEAADWDVPKLQQVMKDFEPLELELAGWSPEEVEAMEVPEATDWGDALGGLPDGDGSGFMQMTFTVTDDQALVVKAALTKARGATAGEDTGNRNRNGNALFAIARAFEGDD